MKRKKTKKKLIDSTLKLLWEHGYNATSPAAILSDANVGKGSLYHYFRGKEDLVRKTLINAQRLTFRQILVAYDRKISFEKNIKRSIYAVYKFYKGRSFIGGCLFGSLSVEIGETYPEFQIIIRRFFDKIDKYFFNLLKRNPDFSFTNKRKMNENIKIITSNIVSSYQGALVRAVSLSKNDPKRAIFLRNWAVMALKLAGVKVNKYIF